MSILLKNFLFFNEKQSFDPKSTINTMAKLLVIDDERAIRNILKETLEFEGYKVDVAENGQQGVEMAQSKNYDLIYSDVKMPQMDGTELLAALKQPDSPCADVPVVMISGHGNIETAVECIKQGAYDFLEKPLDLNRLLVTTRHAIDSKQLRHEATTLRNEATALKKKVNSKYQMIGSSAAINRVREMIAKVAPTEARVLITGANGTGKEVAARMLFEQSHRADMPLVTCNCAAIPSELIESELFGHTKGSFTGAVKDRAGKFEQANGGTLFLDEIGDMSLAAQTKVLRALQEGEVTRVGSDKPIAVNVRVIAATNKDLQKEIEKGTFREDLFHRLNVIPIHVPSLDERKEDIPELVTFFTSQICEEQGWAVKKFSKDAIAALQARHWPGNIRELRNVVERLIILSGAEISAADIEHFA